MVRRNLEAAYQVATALPLASRQSTLLILEQVAASPKPQYQPSRGGRTVRIFASSNSYLGLPKRVRQTLMGGCVEFDLRSAHLAIVTSLWGLPRTRELLMSGRSVWSELAGAAEVDLYTFKPVLKEALYATVYGMRRSNVARLLEQTPGWTVNMTTRVLNCEVILELFDAREAHLQALLESGETVTVFGERLGIVSRRDAVRALASVAQSYELYLLWPAATYIMAQPDLRLMAWQHDGFTVHCSNRSKLERHVKRLMQMVAEHAGGVGCETQLEWEELGAR
jgi:hypothetical protein